MFIWVFPFDLMEKPKAIFWLTQYFQKSKEITAGYEGSPDASVGKESACNAGDTGDTVSISGLGRSPGGGNGNPLQYSSLENLMDRGAWQAAVQRITKSQTGLRD